MCNKAINKDLGKHISGVADISDLLIDTQNRVSQDRRRTENIFILNTVLETNKQDGKQLHFLFEDLVAAYDRVDVRMITSRLKQYNLS